MQRAMKALRLSEQVKQKQNTLKRILEISSIDKLIRRLLLMLLKIGPEAVDESFKTTLFAYSKTILDRENQLGLQECVGQLAGCSNTQQRYFQLFFKVIKYNILSIVEKDYVQKIQKKIEVGNQLDDNIREVQLKIDQHKSKVLGRYKAEKQGRQVSFDRSSVGALAKQLLTQQDRLQLSTQKLNNLRTTNNSLRQKINELRKQKNVIERIKVKLQSQQQRKDLQLQGTVELAAQVLDRRKQAQSQLKKLKQGAEAEKHQFSRECDRMNQKIKEDIKFRQFLKSKQKDMTIYNQLARQIQNNEQQIKEKQQNNTRLDAEYKSSSQKEEEVRKSYQRIRKQLCVFRNSLQKQSETIHQIFVSLYEKSARMQYFVGEMEKQVFSLDEKIEEHRKQIQQLSMQGDNLQSQEDKSQMQFMQACQQGRKSVIKNQYSQTLQTVAYLRQVFQKLFKTLDICDTTNESFENESFAYNRQRLQKYMGLLETKVLNSISFYARVVAESIKKDKGDSPQVQNNISDLSNILAYDNGKTMASLNTGGKMNSLVVEEVYRQLKQEYQQARGDIKLEPRELDVRRESEQEMKVFALQKLKRGEVSISKSTILKSKKPQTRKK